MNKINLDEYNIIALQDCYSDIIYGLIAINKKHNIKDFQDEINRVKELPEIIDNINKYGDDWNFIQEEISDNFDWIELDFNLEDYVQY